MLSADDDPSMVWKGINHGACGYLLKPVRLEEVKNIWQHVYRRKRVVLEELKMCRTGHVADPSHEKVGKKQKDENEKHDDNAQRRDEDPSCLRTRKKTRLSWSPELHRKFIAVVNHLGIESRSSNLNEFVLILSVISNCENTCAERCFKGTQY